MLLYHELIELCEIEAFIGGYKDLDKVYNLIRGHMLPYQAADTVPEPFRSRAKEKLLAAISTAHEGFTDELAILHLCDELGSVRTDDALVRARAHIGLFLAEFEDC